MTSPMMESPPAPQRRSDAPQTEMIENAWRPLYWIGGVAAGLSVLIIVMAVFVFLVWPPPSSMSAWFTLFQQNPVRGLLDLDLLLVASYVVMAPFYLALWAALRRLSPSLMAIALAFNFVGMALILAVNPAFAMLSLSGDYANATSDAQRTAFLAAGQGLLANWSGTSFVLGYALGAIGVLLTSVVMLRSELFSNVIAYVGLLMGFLMLVPASAGTFGLIVSLVSLVPTVVWLGLLTRRFLQMSREGSVDFVVAHPKKRRSSAGATPLPG